MATAVALRLRAADHPPRTRVVDVTRPLVAAGFVLRQTRQGLMAVRSRRPK